MRNRPARTASRRPTPLTGSSAISTCSQVRALAAKSRGSGGVTGLASALHLLSGEPFTNLRKDGSGWLPEGDRLDHIMTAAVVDVGHLLASQALAVGDLDLADFASNVALTASRTTRSRTSTASRSTGPPATRTEPPRACGATTSIEVTTTSGRSFGRLEPRKSSRTNAHPRRRRRTIIPAFTDRRPEHQGLRGTSNHPLACRPLHLGGGASMCCPAGTADRYSPAAVDSPRSDMSSLMTAPWCCSTCWSPQPCVRVVCAITCSLALWASIVVR